MPDQELNNSGLPFSRGRAATLEEVAAMAGVSRSTASRVINGGDRVSAKAQAAVEQAIATLGYSPNRAARSLVTKRSDAIALVIPEPDDLVLTDPFFARTLNGLAGVLDDRELQLLLVMVRPGQHDRTARYLSTANVDGVIVASHHRDDALDQVIANSNIPHVLIGRPFSLANEVHYVDVDNFMGGMIVGQHLMERGYRKIATIAGPQDMAPGIDRLSGWKAALSDAGLDSHRIVPSGFSTEAGVAATEELLERFPDTDAIFCASDLIAVGTLRVLAQHNKRVPEDIAVVGFDDLGVATSTTPLLTTVANPVSELARAAASLLLRQLAGEADPAEQPKITPRLVVRSTT